MTLPLFRLIIRLIKSIPAGKAAGIVRPAEIVKTSWRITQGIKQKKISAGICSTPGTSVIWRWSIVSGAALHSGRRCHHWLPTR